MERLPLGKHLELTLKATRSVFAKRVLAKQVLARHVFAKQVFARRVFAKHVLEKHVFAEACGLERELKDAAST
jgi:hypothetical protein